MSIVDADIRLRALDPTLSFCVSAPAGSGKTELLIQRYLSLLSRVEKPEQVLAITFTRKAAAEMRERVLQALQGAVDDVPCDSDHQILTRKFATQAIAADASRQWNIIRNSAQLNIKTIDSFCSALTRQMPVLSDFGGQANVTDHAGELYAEAVQELFALVVDESGISDDLKALMLHFDNDWSKLQDLLVAMLGRREQWGTYLGVHHRAEEAEEYLRSTVTALVEDALASLGQKIAPYSSELLALQNYAAKNLETTAMTQFPGESGADLPAWHEIRQLLLTADKAGKWRAQVNVKMGFPAGKGEKQDYKDRVKAVIAELREVEGLLEELVSVSSLPQIEGNSDSWILVLHLSRILPMLSAQLLLVFQRHGTVDHTQVALSALQALGTDENPTELALRMDYQLQHLLLDEFQDTAINQYDLVTRLTRGWGEHNETHPDNPRSIMIVGDGMQSIYGFRNANVGLFLRARQEGFNGVPLEALSLLSNFRSDEGIVQWVNDTFSSAFPAEDNIGRSQIRYTAATAVKPPGAHPAVGLHSFRGDNAAQQEIDFICSEVQLAMADPACSSIAILARTRGHLQGILDKFKQQDMRYSAQDIDSLANSHVIVDLMSLCRALHNPADTVAWMAILRAPWCGLKLSDLHALATLPGSFSPWEVLSDETSLGGLSDDGQLRTRFLAAALLDARNNHDRLTLRIWLEQLWTKLGGPGVIEMSEQLNDAERFFQLLEQAEIEGEGLNLAWLETRLQRLYVKAENPDSKIQVMTLHKAKGLEFDWVIIPSLHKTTRVNTRPLLNWDEHNSESGGRGFLLAANDHSGEGEPSLYNYLEIQRSKKELEETTRLLYVGVTRAVSRLILTASPTYKEEKEAYNTPPGRSLLGRIWPTFEAQMVQHEPSLIEAMESAAEAPLLRRVKRVAVVDIFEYGAPARGYGNRPQRSLNRADRAVGTVVHLVMEALSALKNLPNNLDESFETCWSKEQILFELRRLGLSGAGLRDALQGVEASIARVLQDESGRWVLSSAHKEAGSELALTTIDKNGVPTNLIIDRTFVDPLSGLRWLVDYKNSQPHEEEALEDFLNREEAAYYTQLADYKNALSGLGKETVQCALYFTALGCLHKVSETPSI
ncbi:MAG: UvrD-helicase domain-containing protein [Proteobacteria bacterium]|nr:UvrD-helicase domain-containing protein [Pseudomonadota bacterium]